MDFKLARPFDVFWYADSREELDLSLPETIYVVCEEKLSTKVMMLYKLEKCHDNIGYYIAGECLGKLGETSSEVAITLRSAGFSLNDILTSLVGYRYPNNNVSSDRIPCGLLVPFAPILKAKALEEGIVGASTIGSLKRVIKILPAASWRFRKTGRTPNIAVVSDYSEVLTLSDAGAIVKQLLDDTEMVHVDLGSSQKDINFPWRFRCEYNEANDFIEADTIEEALMKLTLLETSDKVLERENCDYTWLEARDQRVLEPIVNRMTNYKSSILAWSLPRDWWSPSLPTKNAK